MKEVGIEEHYMKVKICGLYREEDIEAVNEAMPDYIGFIIGFEKSHRNVTKEQVRAFKGKLDPKIKAVGVFVNPTIEDILAIEDVLDVIQLHGGEDNRYIMDLRKVLPEKEIWKAFKIRGIMDLDVVADSIADNVVLDNGYGTGETFDWTLLDIVARWERPFIIAGGITASNIREAVERFHPFALDISSGVETDRQKDREKIKEAVQLARGE